ncbi:hypothetical protein SZ55_3958 [Pseudomonas sp. FeS53a]|nr:hypothetical protein SZ55_3958 [Pseudomonas sp. FeS53a]
MDLFHRDQGQGPRADQGPVSPQDEQRTAESPAHPFACVHRVFLWLLGVVR